MNNLSRGSANPWPCSTQQGITLLVWIAWGWSICLGRGCSWERYWGRLSDQMKLKFLNRLLSRIWNSGTFLFGYAQNLVAGRSYNGTRNKLLNLPSAMNLYWQYMSLSSIFGHWAGKLLSFVKRLFLVCNICGTPFPQTFTIFWQVSQMWLTWAYWMERKKQCIVFTRNANMTFLVWRQPLFQSHGRGNKKRLIFIVSIKHSYNLVFWYNVVVEVILNRLL